MTESAMKEFNDALTHMNDVVNRGIATVAAEIASATTFFNSWLSVDPDLKPIADQFKAQWLKADQFRFTSVGGSLSATLSGNVEDGIGKALGLFGGMDKIREGGEFAMLPSAPAPYTGKNPHAAACFWYAARVPVAKLLVSATDVQCAIASAVCKMAGAAKQMESDVARVKIQDMYETWREQYLALAWPESADTDAETIAEARARMDLCILRMGTSHDTPEAAAKWLWKQLPVSEFMHGRAEAHIADALACAESVPAGGVTEFKAQFLNCLKAVTEDARDHLVPQMSRIRGVAKEWVKQYPWLKPMADHAMADVDEQVRVRLQLLTELTTVAGDDAEADYKARNPGVVQGILARDSRIRKGMPTDYFGATLKAGQLTEEQAQVAVAFNCALVSEVETLGCMLIENILGIRGVAGAFSGLIRSQRVPAEHYEFWRKSVGAWVDTVFAALAGAPAAEVSSKDVATVSKSIAECTGMGLGDLSWGQIAGQCLKAMAINNHVTPEKIEANMEKMMANGFGDNPLVGLVKGMESMISPEILHGIRICEQFGDCHDPRRGGAGLADLMKMLTLMGMGGAGACPVKG